MHISRVSTSYVALLYEFLSQRGIEPEALLGPAPDERKQPYVSIPVWRHMLETAAGKAGGPAFGLQVGRAISPRHFGIVGYLVLASASLGEALAHAERYSALVYDVNPLRLAIEGNQAVLRWGTGYGRPGQLVDETGIAALVRMARDITASDLSLAEVSFVNAEPDDLAPYEAFFGCPVHFQRSCTELRFPVSLLRHPLRQPDAALLALLDRQADAMLARQRPAGDDEEPYRRALVPLLREGRASLESLAETFHVSPRSLQRRLAAQGTSYQVLLDETRQALAREYLADSRLSLTDVAALLGFSEQSAFTRAFRQWTGETPGRWRKRT